jgi:hypothetical protein
LFSLLLFTGKVQRGTALVEEKPRQDWLLFIQQE